MTEFIHLYTADGWTGEMIQGDACREGVLEWVPKERVEQLPIWEGDKIFFKLLNEEHPWFSLKLVYEGDVLRQAVLEWGKNRGLICQRRKHFTEKLAQHSIHALRRPDGGDHQLVGVDAGKSN